MAYKAVKGTKKASGNHDAGGTDSTTQTGDVYIAWDTSKITHIDHLKGVLKVMLKDIEGGKF